MPQKVGSACKFARRFVVLPLGGPQRSEAARSSTPSYSPRTFSHCASPSIIHIPFNHVTPRTQIKLKARVLSWSAFFIIGLSFAAFGEPQIIQLDDSTKLTLLGVTTGPRQMAPGYEKLATANWFYTSDQSSVIWILAEHDPGKSLSYELLISDKAKPGCVNLEKGTASHVRDGIDIQGFALLAFPRWDKEMLARVKPYQAAISKGEFVITNPVPGVFEHWTPELLPITKSDGDLEVTLTKLIAGAPSPYRQGQHPLTNDPANQCVHLDFNFRQNGQPTPNWTPWRVFTSDAAGNHVRGVVHNYPSNGINPIYPDRIHPSFPPVFDGYFYRPGLWQDQSPWKVRLEFIHQSNFSDEETVTFTNLAVQTGSQDDYNEEWTRDAGKTNFNFVAEQMVNGVKLKLLPPLIYSPDSMADEKHLAVLIYADPGQKAQTMNLTLLQATDEKGQEVVTPFRTGGGWAGHFALDFPGSREMKTLNLKLALHKSRFVEFTVTPTRQ